MIRLPVTIHKDKDPRGRIQSYTAQLGDLEAHGATAREAEESLAAVLVAVAAGAYEKPYLLRSWHDGAILVVHRMGAGWGYTHYRERPGCPGELVVGCSSGGSATRDEAVSRALAEEACGYTALWQSIKRSSR